MVNRGVLPLLVGMIAGDEEKDQLAACYTLWNLSFDKEVAKQIKVN